MHELWFTEELKRNKDTLLDHYAALTLQALDGLTLRSATSSTRRLSSALARARTGPLGLVGHSGTVSVFVKRNLHPDA